jgi:hypothetical protein
MSSSATPTGSSSQGRHSTTPHDATDDAANGGTRHKAGAFDIRTFIGALIGIYGLVLTLVGILGPSDSQISKAGGVNINLWAGIGMIVVAAGFLVWAKVRPVIVPEDIAAEHAGGHPGGH